MKPHVLTVEQFAGSTKAIDSAIALASELFEMFTIVQHMSVGR